MVAFFSLIALLSFGFVAKLQLADNKANKQNQLNAKRRAYQKAYRASRKVA